MAAEWVKAGRVNVSDPRYREFQRMQLKEPVCMHPMLFGSTAGYCIFYTLTYINVKDITLHYVISLAQTA